MINEIRDKVNDYKIRVAQGGSFPIDVTPAETMLAHIDNKHVRSLEPENVEFHNSLQITQSTRFIYSNCKDFELAKDMLRADPALRV